MIGSDGTDYLTARNGVWHFVRRVPVDYARLDRRGIVKLTTKVKVAADRSGAKAGRVAARINETVRQARSMDLDYVAPAEGAQRPIAEVLSRIETWMDGDGLHDPARRKAALGAVPVPVIML